MDQRTISERIDALTATARERMKNSSSACGAEVAYMTSEELREFHAIKIGLPNQKQLAQEARARVMQKYYRRTQNGN